MTGLLVAGLSISAGALAAMRSEAARANPQEACGLLLGQGTHIASAIPAVNIHPEPQTHFEIDPQALIDAHRAARAGGAQVLGYYHSHPTSRARPSATDAAMASGDGRVWAIIGEASDVTFWRDGENGFEELSCRVESA